MVHSVPASGDGRRRVVIESVRPAVDDGRFPIKRVVGDQIVVEADLFADGHDMVAGVLQYRPQNVPNWRETSLAPLGNDRWRAEFTVTEAGRYVYTVAGWIDHFATWLHDLEKRVAALQDVTVDLQIGVSQISAALPRAAAQDRDRLREWVRLLQSGQTAAGTTPIWHDAELIETMRRLADRTHATVCDREFAVVVDRELARFGAWYEMFPRSCAGDPHRHGTFADCQARLPYIAEMGFDVLYLPPIHPIGTTFRKGPNNAATAGPGDPGSPWAIGGKAGGHKAIHPELGTLADFRSLVAAAARHNIEIALDIAFQCSPDHPYATAHRSWFRERPDGSIQYAENPPKKYQDIYPFDFESNDWPALWEELKSIFEYWIDQGVRIFRVDNPHTKPFAFWEWLIAEIKRSRPDVLLLSEAFTRPKVMYRLSKLGFTQSYNYFPWRNTKQELTEYFTELAHTDVSEFFRPNLWPNTPDILTAYLQHGGRPAFATRLVLAATLGASYGIYGPEFELSRNVPREPGSEEYLDSEKYQFRCHDLDRSDSLKDLIGRVNRIRRENRALQSDLSLTFHPIDNDELICYSKQSDDGKNIILAVVNLDCRQVQAGRLQVDWRSLGFDDAESIQVHDLLGDATYHWQQGRNFVELNPHVVPAHIFRVASRV